MGSVAATTATPPGPAETAGFASGPGAAVGRSTAAVSEGTEIPSGGSASNSPGTTLEPTVVGASSPVLAFCAILGLSGSRLSSNSASLSITTTVCKKGSAASVQRAAKLSAEFVILGFLRLRNRIGCGADSEPRAIPFPRGLKREIVALPTQRLARN